MPTCFQATAGSGLCRELSAPHPSPAVCQAPIQAQAPAREQTGAALRGCPQGLTVLMK